MLQEIGLESVSVQIEDVPIAMDHVLMMRIDPKVQTLLVARF